MAFITSVDARLDIAFASSSPTLFLHSMIAFFLECPMTVVTDGQYIPSTRYLLPCCVVVAFSIGNECILRCLNAKIQFTNQIRFD